MKIIFDPGMTTIVPTACDPQDELARALGRVFDPKNNTRRWDGQRTVAMPPFEAVVSHDLPLSPLFYHASYAEYLAKCYANHWVYRITPDVVWYTILCEIASLVIDSPKEHEHLFTTTPGQKQSIAIPASDPTELDLRLLLLELAKLVPTRVDLFFPEFTTTTPEDVFGFMAAFAEACTPYYDYFTLVCGLKGVEILGTMEDYEKLERAAGELSGVMKETSSGAYLEKVRHNLTELRQAVRDEDSSFFQKMMYTERCGSGSDVECMGWWVDSMYADLKSGAMLKNLPKHISRVPYTNLDTQRQFALSTGLMYSIEDDGVAVPWWGTVITEVTQ